MSAAESIDDISVPDVQAYIAKLERDLADAYATRDAAQECSTRDLLAAREARAEVRHLEWVLQQIAMCNNGEGYMPELAQKALGRHGLPK